MSLGASNFAIVILFDQTTNTLYVPVLNDNSNTIAVFDTRTCNARNLSGCGQTPATTAVPGVLLSASTALLALDPATHSLYVGDGDDGPVSVVNTATCNGTITSGCSQPATATSTNGDSITVDRSNHSVYVGQILNGLVSVFDGRLCERAMDMLPVSRDAYHGPIVLVSSAEIYGMLGDADRAISLIERALAIPSPQTRQALRVDPKWDSIRSDPRFQQLIAEATAGD
jgi:hypothetical protein